jgi:hypothetical protein
MFFGQKSPLEIRVDKGIAEPYFTVPLPEIEGLSSIVKKQLLLISCIQETAAQLKQLSSVMPINTIEQLIINTSIVTIDPNDTDQDYIEKNKQEWEQLVKACVKDYLSAFTNKVMFNYSYTPSVDQQIPQYTQTTSFERPVLVINIDSLLDYNDVKKLQSILEIQCLQGPAGIMPSEGATSTLLIPGNYPDIAHKQIVSVQTLNPHQQQSIKEQLIQARFKLPSTVLHVGTMSESWVRHWYGQTSSFYREPLASVNVDNTPTLQTEEQVVPDSATTKELTLFDQTTILGYLGAANLSTALASAASLLTNPMASTSEIWLVEHQVNSKSIRKNNDKSTKKSLANIYKITRTTSE